MVKQVVSELGGPRQSFGFRRLKKEIEAFRRNPFLLRIFGLHLIARNRCVGQYHSGKVPVHRTATGAATVQSRPSQCLPRKAGQLKPHIKQRKPYGKKKQRWTNDRGQKARGQRAGRKRDGKKPSRRQKDHEHVSAPRSNHSGASKKDAPETVSSQFWRSGKCQYSLLTLLYYASCRWLNSLT